MNSKKVSQSSPRHSLQDGNKLVNNEKKNSNLVFSSRVTGKSPSPASMPKHRAPDVSFKQQLTGGEKSSSSKVPASNYFEKKQTSGQTLGANEKAPVVLSSQNVTISMPSKAMFVSTITLLILSIILSSVFFVFVERTTVSETVFMSSFSAVFALSMLSVGMFFVFVSKISEE